MHPRRFFGFDWNVGDPMTFKVILCNTDLHKHKMVLHRGVVVPRNLEAAGYNSALAPNSDTYFSEVHLEGGLPSIPDTPVHQGTVDPPILSLQRGEEKEKYLEFTFGNWC